MLDALLTPLLATGELIATYLVDANQRIYWLYSAIAMAMALLVFHVKKLSYKALFSPAVWWHPSARHDYVIFFINRLLKTLGVIPVLLVMAPLAIGFSGWLEGIFGTQTFLDFPSWVIIGIFTLVLFVIDDFTRFLLHYLLHKIPFLWEFHKVHHSAKVLTPITIYRSHPVESILYGARMILSQGIAVGICYYFFGPTLSMFDVFGANVFVFAFNIMGSNLRHSHVWLSWGERLESIFISPAQHQIHHSDKRIHIDCNFGSALAIWDKLFGCLILANTVTSPKDIAFGLGKSFKEHDSLLGVYLKPCINAIKLLITPLLKLIKSNI